MDTKVDSNMNLLTKKNIKKLFQLDADYCKNELKCLNIVANQNEKSKIVIF